MGTVLDDVIAPKMIWNYDKQKAEILAQKAFKLTGITQMLSIFISTNHYMKNEQVCQH